MTDGLNAVWSNDRAASPTDTNPKNLELASPQSVTATRLVYSPNCFQTQLFTRSEDLTCNRSKLKSNALPIELTSFGGLTIRFLLNIPG